jgi:6-pyruvoyltetrahydropterin/6-carboxytetrahydropterin synthase
MYSITTEASFDAAHFLKNYNGKCKNIHGHRWRIILEVQSQSLKTDPQQNGMITDFSDLKRDLKKLADKFDHTLIYEKASLKKELVEMLISEDFALNEVDFRPTAENFSKYFYDEMEKKGYDVARVSVYETPNNCASYSSRNGEV